MAAPVRMSNNAGVGRAITAGTVIAIALIALNGRPAVASIGPVLKQIRHGVPLSSTGASALTAVPLICFGVAAPLGTRLARRLGHRAAVATLMLVLIVGLIVRLGPDSITLFLGTIVAASGIAGLNVLLPAMIRQDYPQRTGLMMGVYAFFLIGSAAAAAGLTIPLQHAIGGGWRSGLAPWAILAGLGLLVWLTQVDRVRPVPTVDAPGEISLLHDRLAWLVTAYFALQSASFYAALTWLPTLFTDHGLSATKAGALLSLSALVQTPAGLVVPAIATRVRHQGPLVAASTLATAIGWLLLVTAPVAAAYPAVIALGIGQGAAFPLGLTIMVLRAPTPEATTRMSSMAQSLGYLIAAIIGPLAVGLLHAASGGWTVPLILLLGLLAPQLATGWRAATPRIEAAGRPQPS